MSIKIIEAQARVQVDSLFAGDTFAIFGTDYLVTALSVAPGYSYVNLNSGVPMDIKYNAIVTPTELELRRVK